MPHLAESFRRVPVTCRACRVHVWRALGAPICSGAHTSSQGRSPGPCNCLVPEALPQGPGCSCARGAALGHSTVGWPGPTLRGLRTPSSLWPPVPPCPSFFSPGLRELGLLFTLPPPLFPRGRLKCLSSAHGPPQTSPALRTPVSSMAQDLSHETDSLSGSDPRVPSAVRVTARVLYHLMHWAHVCTRQAASTTTGWRSVGASLPCSIRQTRACPPASQGGF